MAFRFEFRDSENLAKTLCSADTPFVGQGEMKAGVTKADQYVVMFETGG